MKKILLGLLVLIILASGAFIYLLKGRSSKVISTKYNEFSFICEADDVDKSLFDRIDGQYYLALDFIKDKIDKDVDYNENEKIITFANDKGTKRIKVGEMKMLQNGNEVALRDPVIEKDNKIFVPIEAFIYDYPVELRYIDDLKLLIMDYTNINYAKGTLKGQGTNLREEASLQSPIIKNLQGNEEILVFGEEGDFYKVRIKDGYKGYIKKDLLEVDFGSGKFSTIKDAVTTEAKRPLNLTWDYTYSTQSDASIAAISPIEGLEVICPTWFSIGNENGDLIDRGKMEYVTKYKSLGIDVWGYLDNSFDPNITEATLKSPTKREYIINQVIRALNYYGMKGLNIDFEHTKIDSRDDITQFTKEIAARLKQHGIKVSIDVTPQISKDVTKEPYDRVNLSKHVDYVMLMAYDQHWGSSTKAGSVAEYKWVEGNINNLIRQIPRDKFILCIPTYTRIWTEKPDGSVSSTTASMAAVQDIIAKRGLTPKFDEVAKQNYVQYQDNDGLKKIWIEDNSSIEHKLTLINKYNLGGVASWRKGFETSSVWPLIKNTVIN